jgi:DNA/RNA endonuclease G (NUC1)
MATKTQLFALWFIGWSAVLSGKAAAETDAQWKPTAANKISTCRSLWIGLADVPADTNAASRDTTFVCHPRFVLSHDNVTKTPDWVIERLTKKQVSGNNNRPGKKFSAELRVPPRGRAVDKDYPPNTTGFARGHMAPSEDFNASATAMRDTFVLSNAVPQVGAKFNSAIWGRLEDEVRRAAKARGEIYVITGPVRGTGTARSRTIAQADNACGKKIEIDGPIQTQFCASNNKNGSIACTRGVGVPIALYKIVYDAKQGNAYAFVLPNRDHPHRTGDEARPYLAEFRVSVAAIEGLTGLKFFQDLPAAKKEKLVKQCAADTLWLP